MRLPGSPESLAATCPLAVARLLSGWEPQEVADFLAVNVSSVCRWSERFERGGWAARVPGRPRKLTARQAKRVLRWVRNGNRRDFGFRTGRWTARRLTAVIERRVGVEVQPPVPQ